MWCQKCQADVAGIASPDNERALCTTCGNEIARTVRPQSIPSETVPPQPEKASPDQTAADQTVASPAAPVVAAPLHSAPLGSTNLDSTRPLRDPRELLARWAREDALNPLEFAVARDPAPDNGKSLKRFDFAHSVAAPRPATFVDSARTSIPVSAMAPAPDLPQTAGPHPTHLGNIVHQAHAPNAPHFQAAPVSLADKSSKWVTLVGQIFAYVGVGGLTVGTSLVLMGYFGGPASYVTTGWLVTTAGQMLLFLGVITLVSGGMEQTTQEVARRIDTLGERLVRIEQATERAEARK